MRPKLKVKLKPSERLKLKLTLEDGIKTKTEMNYKPKTTLLPALSAM